MERLLLHASTRVAIAVKGLPVNLPKGCKYARLRADIGLGVLEFIEKLVIFDSDGLAAIRPLADSRIMRNTVWKK